MFIFLCTGNFTLSRSEGFLTLKTATHFSQGKGNIYINSALRGPSIFFDFVIDQTAAGSKNQETLLICLFS